jgi:hypothetical protein|tara:strand:- start:4502 stop:4735 length:234 start_codon:yes stop_codon:yes gene_type:complete
VNTNLEQTRTRRQGFEIHGPETHGTLGTTKRTRETCDDARKMRAPAAPARIVLTGMGVSVVAIAKKVSMRPIKVSSH